MGYSSNVAVGLAMYRTDFFLANEQCKLGLGGLFQEQASANGAATAIESDGHALSYADLHWKALYFAWQIHSLRPSDDTPIGILIPRGMNHILAQVAVLYSGRSCVPLDAKLPDDHLRGMLHNVNAALVISDQESEHRLLTFTHLIADHAMEAEVPDPRFQPLLKGPKSCSHIFHTSGTTGKPKAIEIFAEGLINLCHDPVAFVKKGERVGHAASAAFDISLVEIWGSLLNGATVVVIPMRTVLDPLELSHIIRIKKLDVVQLTTSLLDVTAYACPGAFSTLDTLITGGEAINAQTIRSIFEAGAPRRIINGYGPTECSVYTLWHHVSQEEAQHGEIPVGKPFRHVETSLVDETLTPVKPGEIGELLVTGAGVAGGYIGEPEKTAKSFVSLPRLPLEGNRGPGHIYRTGDLMRINEDGVHYYIGRRDSQVKIRGQRVEIEALEFSLLDTKLVSAAVVIKITPKEVGRNPFLLAFCVPISPCVTVAAITKAYVERCPHLLVPRIELTHSLPLKTSGKADRGQLERQYVAKIQNSRMRAKTTGNNVSNVKAELISLWLDVLGLPTKDLDPTDDFIAMGGNSLMAVTLLARINRTFGISLRASMLYENPTLGSLTKLLVNLQHEGMGLTDQIEQETWLQDSRLGQHLKPLAGTVPDWEGVSEGRVFLTGATGFVGAFFLTELLQRPTVKKVACLVRANNEAAGRLRLEKILRKYQIHPDLGKVVVVPGSFGEANLGLDVEEYDYYAEWASVVFHLGAKVSYVAPYSSHRADNVVGTCNILKFASHKRPKATHYTSTIAAYGPTGFVTGTKFVHEDERPAPHLAALHYDTGYAQSQYVAEAIVWNAIDNGLPIAVYRPGFVLGHSKTGVCNTNDFVGRVFTSCMEMGCYPLLPYQRKEFIPSKDNLGHAYNLVHPDKANAIDICTSFTLLKSICPYPMRGVAYTEWVHSLSLRTNDPLYPLVPMLKEKVLDERTRWEVYENMVDAPKIRYCSSMAQLFERYLNSWLPVSSLN
ncbi:putative NRPS-like enzyme [Aspergillus leporis]|uniref:Putative NRPS-like enzyme n=1 Tax=Aspergillus leporis TaxID=41062 RepID=A0A5N5X8B1_9EURO|nr:putative NRPS-like enzyme [Aspergillus leporis]